MSEIITERVIEDSYAAVDAAFLIYCAISYNDVKIRRDEPTSGSALYSFTSEEKGRLLTVFIRQLDATRTHLTARIRAADNRPDLFTVGEEVLDHFLAWRRIDLQRTISVPPPDDVARPILPGQLPRMGAPTKPYNDWAREQIEAGGDREEIYREWLRRQDKDAESPDVRAANRDAFRKALARKRTDGRK